MALNRCKLGELIEVVEEKNSDLVYCVNDVRGISIQKKFIETKADMEGVSLSPYLIIKPKCFCYVPVTSRNGDKISLAYNDSDDTYIVSSSYIAFKVKDENKLLPLYLFMYFNRSDFDRYSRFNSWGSARETFEYKELCDIDFELPDIEIQQKYVDIYKGMIENQKAYERGLEDLKLVCDVTIENLRKKQNSVKIGQFLEYTDEKNTDLSITLTQGVNVDMQFMPAKREAEDQESARIVRNNWFAFNKVMKSNGTKLPIALREGEDCVVSGSYQTFKVSSTDKLSPKYLMLWLTRKETQRYCGFNAWGSTRDIFDFKQICELKFPVPNIEIQQNIVNIYETLNKRKKINENLKQSLKSICPILIKGSIEEALKEA